MAASDAAVEIRIVLSRNKVVVQLHWDNRDMEGVYVQDMGVLKVTSFKEYSSLM